MKTRYSALGTFWHSGSMIPCETAHALFTTWLTVDLSTRDVFGLWLAKETVSTCTVCMAWVASKTHMSTCIRNTHMLGPGLALYLSLFVLFVFHTLARCGGNILWLHGRICKKRGCGVHVIKRLAADLSTSDLVHTESPIFTQMHDYVS